jgi:hypothetical protein
MQQQIQTNKEGIDALILSLAALPARPSPTIPDEHLVKALQKPVRKLFREHTELLIDNLSTDFEGFMQTLNEDS